MFPVLIELWPAVAILYLIDCLVRVRSDNQLLVSTFRGRRFRRFEAGIRLLAPWPWVRAYRLPDLAVGAVPEGLYVATAEVDGGRRFDPSSYRLLAWSRVGQLVVEHRRIFLPENPPLLLPSPAHARAFAGRLRRLAALDLPARQRALEEIEGGQRVAAFEQRRQAIDQALRGLRPIVAAAWLATLIFLPATLYLWPHPPLALRIAAIAGALALIAAVMAVATVRGLSRSDSVGTDGVLLPLLMSPPNLLRADAAITIDLLQGFHVTVAAAALLERGDLVRLLRRWRHGAQFALGHASDRPWQGWWRRQRERIDRLASQRGIDVAELRAPPPTADRGAELVCPLCAGGYSAQAEACADCAMPLMPVAAD